MVLAGLLWIAAMPSSWAISPSDGDLTLDQLQDRLDHPVQREGKSTINLRQVTLDLRDENSVFRDRFYRLLQNRLQSGNTVLNLDLSNAVIKGPFDLQRLSLREPLYGEAFFPLLTEQEQAQLRRDRKRLSQLSQLSRSLLLQPQPTALRIYLFRGGLNMTQARFDGPVLASDIFFLKAINAQGTQFSQGVNFSESRFSQVVSFMAGQFQQAVRFRSCLFFDRLRMGQSVFQDSVTFQGSEFLEGVSFGQSIFFEGANFSRTTFQGNADFGKSVWQSNSTFVKSTFVGDVFLTDAQLEAPISFRQSRLNHAVNLRGTLIQSQVDFGDASFGSKTRINVSGLDFNPEQGEILGSPGQIGRVLSVPTLEGNATLLRNLVRNFRTLEQIEDANQLEYTTERLRLRSLQRQLTGVNLNTASRSRLQTVGFSVAQSQGIFDQRQVSPLIDPADMLDLEGFDLSTYVRVRDRIIARAPISLIQRFQILLQWLVLAVLLLISHYGTSMGLTVGVGIVTVALSSLLFWWVDRYRRRLPTPIMPPWGEVVCMLSSFAGLMTLGTLIVLRFGDAPLMTGGAIALFMIPVPIGLTTILYRRGRFHDELDTSYLVEDGGLRQLRLLIARLPIIPKFPFFRDRYYPIDWQKRRNWLNYYDFSLNNWFKFGFNDIRLRDKCVPGLVTALVWYQWAIGLVYIAVLLWTFSRTIPGLNLLLYF